MGNNTPCIRCGSYSWRRNDDGREVCGLCGTFPFPDGSPIPAKRIDISPVADTIADEVRQMIRDVCALQTSSESLLKIAAAIQLAIDEAKATEASDG